MLLTAIDCCFVYAFVFLQNQKLCTAVTTKIQNESPGVFRIKQGNKKNNAKVENGRCCGAVFLIQHHIHLYRQNVRLWQKITQEEEWGKTPRYGVLPHFIFMSNKVEKYH